MSPTYESDIYLHVRPRQGAWDRKLTVERTSTRRPDEPAPGCVVVKLTLRIPGEVFEPISPSAVVEVPADLVQRAVEVTAVQA